MYCRLYYSSNVAPIVAQWLEAKAKAKGSQEVSKAEKFLTCQNTAKEMFEKESADPAVMEEINKAIRIESEAIKSGGAEEACTALQYQM